MPSAAVMTGALRVNFAFQEMSTLKRNNVLLVGVDRDIYRFLFICHYQSKTHTTHFDLNTAATIMSLLYSYNVRYPKHKSNKKKKIAYSTC